MWTIIGLWILGVLVVCSISAVLLRLQPIGAKPGIVNMLAGLTIGRGLRLVSRLRMSGNKQLLVGTIMGWMMWSVLGSVVIALVSPGYKPGSLYLLYGLLCGLAGAIAGVAAGLMGGTWYAAKTNMSSFEGKSGYFVVLIGLLGGIIGFIVVGIGTTIFFANQ